MKSMVMTFKEKSDLYKNNFDLGFMGKNISDKITLFVLIAYITDAMRKKDPDKSTYEVTKLICKNDTLPDEYITSIALITESLMYGCNEFPNFGFNSNKEMVSKCREIILKFVPF